MGGRVTRCAARVLGLAGLGLLLTTCEPLDLKQLIMDASNLRHRILFSSYRDEPGSGELYAMEFDGSAVARLTENGSYETPLCWSRDGSCAVFIGNGMLQVLDCRDSTIHTISTDLNAFIGCSPDSRKLAYYTNQGHVIVATFTGNVVFDFWSLGIPLYPGEGFDWSPDGSQIAFSFNGLINVINAGGSGLRSLTPGYAPAWSPDGTRIAFTLSDGARVMNSDGTGVVDISDGAIERSLRWSPNGDYIAYCDGQNYLCTMRSNGTGKRNVSQSMAVGLFWWSPGSDRILFQYSDDIYVVGPNGAGLQCLTLSSTSDWPKGWSPDGSRILFESLRNGVDNEIYTMNSAGSDLRNLTNNPAEDVAAAW